MIRKLSTTVVGILFVISFMPVLAEDIYLEFLMPGDMFGPGSLFSLDLAVENTGNAYSNAQLFVALNVGTEDFWFYPSWIMYPPNIDWEDVFVPAYASDQWVILPTFSWPHGAGSFEGAMFLAAIVHNGDLISNLAETHFGWSEAPQPTPTPSGPTPTSTPVPMEFVYISPGTYTRGSPEDEPCRRPNERPQHQVTLTRGFYMMTTGVTRQMWADLQAAKPTLPNDPSDTSTSPTMNHPAQRVTWYEAVLFANLMSLRYGYTRCYYKDAEFTTPVDASNYTSGSFYCNFDANGYRLPTEGEREYFTRAGTTGPFWADEPDYSSGNCLTCRPDPPLNVLDSIAWWCGNSGGTAHPVGTKLPNPWGLYDMHGNVWEWCWDWYDWYPSGSVTDPTGPSSGTRRMIRGGGWCGDARSCRSADRSISTPDYRSSYQGFRLVRTANGTQPTHTPTSSPSTPTPSPATSTPIPPTRTPGQYEPGGLYSVDNIVGNLRFVPAGTFTQGSPFTELCRHPDEGPQFEHTLTRNLAVMETEITRGMWADLKAAQSTLPDDPSDTSKSPTMDHPANGVTWYEGVLFANVISIENGFTPCYYLDYTFETVIDETNYITNDVYCDFDASGYRLPTEGEREYFTRAGTTGPFWADEPDYSSDTCNTCDPDPPLDVLDSIAWWCRNSGSWPMAHPVGTKLANPWNLKDVHGNVWEWCWDRWSPFYPTGPVTDYTGPKTTGSTRVFRGGSWGRDARGCRSAHRSGGAPCMPSINRGFRLLRTTRYPQS